MALIAAHLNAGVILVVTVCVAIGIKYLPPSPSLIGLVVSVNVEHHVYLLTYCPNRVSLPNGDDRRGKKSARVKLILDYPTGLLAFEETD